MNDLSKEKRIKAEIERINKYFIDADENKRAVADPLIKNAAFMKVLLDETQEIINHNGVTDHYTNGRNQEGEKISAVVQAYNSLIKNYTAIIKTLLNIVPYAKNETKVKLLEQLQDNTPTETDEERTARINAEIARAAAWQAEQRTKEKNNN